MHASAARFFCSVDLGPEPAIVDARPPQLYAVETTVQEMTGDWHSYPWADTHAPTQDLASAIYARRDAPLGLTAPSARNPLQDNLILFADRLLPRSISFARLLPWHSNLLSESPPTRQRTVVSSASRSVSARVSPRFLLRPR